MDRKTIIVLVACFLLMFSLPKVANKLFPPIPSPTNAPPATLSITNGSGTNVVITTVTSPATQSPEAPLAVPVITVDTNTPEQLLEVTTPKAHYTFTSHGGGLKTVELLEYLENTSTKQGRRETNKVATLNRFSPVPTLGLMDGGIVQGDGIYKLTRITNGVRAEKALSNGLAIVKDFTIGSNYLVNASVRFVNQGTQPHTLPALQVAVGTATPMGARDDITTIGVMWHSGSSKEDISDPWFDNKKLGCVPGTPRPEYRAGASNVVWAAAHNQFFTLAVMPHQPADSIVMRRVELPRWTGDAAKFVATNAPPPKGILSALAYPATLLAPNQSIERQVTIYAGPKEYQTLVQISAQYKNSIDLVMGYGPPFGFFAKALLLTMNWFHETLKLSYGLAIVVITIIIKLLFWPLTQASTRSMKRLQALQPQMNEIRVKYKDDPVKMNRKTMEFMKENKVSPLGGCLPMLLQIPVFFGFFTMIRSAIELRGAQFLWVGDLSKPDTLYTLQGLGFIPFLGIPGVGLPLNPLPLIMGVTMIWQARLTPPSPGMDPMQQKIMRYLPVIFMLFLYNFSAGLTLYWTVQNILTIIQTKLTKTQTAAAVVAPVKPAVLTRPQKKRK
jgi:YidC/Oxa1 family membrane protein insertase